MYNVTSLFALPPRKKFAAKQTLLTDCVSVYEYITYICISYVWTDTEITEMNKDLIHLRFYEPNWF